MDEQSEGQFRADINKTELFTFQYYYKNNSLFTNTIRLPADISGGIIGYDSDSILKPGSQGREKE